MLFKKLICLIIYLIFGVTAWGQSSNKSHNVRITSNPPGAMVYIEGSMVGITPCELKFDMIGEYRVRAYKKGYENWTSNVFFSDRNNSPLNIKLSSKTRLMAAIRSIIVPGWGQRYCDNKTKGIIIELVQTGSIISSIVYEVKYRNAVETYNDALKNYNIHKNNFQKHDIYRSIVEDKYSNINSFYKTRNIFLLTAGAVWLYNILDAIFMFPTYHERVLGENSLSSAYQIYNGAPQIVISKTFNLGL